jgi:hypothetical protein
MNYFFLSDTGRKKGYHMFPQYVIQEMLKSGDEEKATEKVFAGVDFKKMNQEFKEFVLGLEPHLKKPEKK